MRITRRIVTGLVAAFLFTCFGGMLAAHARPAAAAASAKASVQQISGEISSWSDNAFTLKVGATAWKFSYDKKACFIAGKAAVGAKAQVKYIKEGENKIARNVKIVK
ncbi:MAG: hypothetical protein EB084_15455 [Proteobacteria bacterium]|nr:hypothetical protein [Pseudomonadota bacterium]